MNFAEQLFHFYKDLRPPQHLPNDVAWLYPQKDPEVLALVEQFFQKFYNDTHPRILMLGINPGRFGAGVTGVNFTAPKQLKEDCRIDHHLKPQSEISAEFIYNMIRVYGGPKKFYKDCFIGSVCPLGFIQHGKNINYYDDKELLHTVAPFIIANIQKLLTFPFRREKCLCIGGEKNFKYLSKLNVEHEWFDEIIPLPHPRFIMQYRRTQKEQFIQQYLKAVT